MKCPACGCSGYHNGHACWSCGKGGAVRQAEGNEGEIKRGGGEPRHYSAFGKGKGK